MGMTSTIMGASYHPAALILKGHHAPLDRYPGPYTGLEGDDLDLDGPHPCFMYPAIMLCRSDGSDLVPLTFLEVEADLLVLAIPALEEGPFENEDGTHFGLFLAN